MHETSIRLAVVMQKRVLQNRWQSEVWEPLAVLAGVEHEAEGPRMIRDDGVASQWLFPGMEMRLHRDEAEGYYLNVSTEAPKVFIMWRLDEESGDTPMLAVPQFVTASYNEAGRMMDGGERVDTVPMPPELVAWVGEFVEQHYRPEPKKRRRPQSFVAPGLRDKAP